MVLRWLRWWWKCIRPVRTTARYQVNDKCEAQYRGRSWFEARITHVSSCDGTYDVEYIDDGECEAYITEDRIRPLIR